MNQTHIHLLVNHVPVIGAILGAITLAYGLWATSNTTKTAAYLLFIIASLGGVVTYLTGEAAEETAEKIQGISKDLIEQHEDSAGIALGALIVLGIASVIGLIITKSRSSLARTTAWVILFISLVSFGLAARTAYIGGQIRHTEVHSGVPVPSGSVQDED